MRILVTGSREWTDRAVLEEALITLTRGLSWYKVTVVHGGARGADLLADQIAHDFDMQVEVHPADWEKHGKTAGPIRNQEMVDLGADICLAFFKQGARNVGTADCARRAELAGIPVRRFVDRTEGGGFGEPRRDPPDSPAPGESRLPGGSDDYLPIAAAGDDPADLWEHITPLSPEEFTRDTRIDWPVIPAGYEITEVVL